MRLLLLIAMLLVGTTRAWAQDPRLTAAALRYAFEQWVQDSGATEASFVTHYRGKPVGKPLNPDHSVELASLSKAITAVCVGQLIEEGVWSATTTVAEVLGAGPPDLTVAQLVTHSGGVAPDQTQGLRWFLRDMNAALTERVATTALKRRRDEVGVFFYNNENYAILGQMVSVALGLPYARVCAERALAPAGVRSAAKSIQMGGTLPWGGWSMTLADYARFHLHWFGPNGAYAKGAPAALRVDLGHGAAYGLGMFQRAGTEGYSFWHVGEWCMPFRLNTGAYAVIWQGEWSVVASYDICTGGGELRAFEAALVNILNNR